MENESTIEIRHNGACVKITRSGKEIVIDDFNLMYNVECASGFHFFRTREEAENY